MPFNIVLVEPEIPQNTGNIARTCSCTGTRLHLVRPFAFEISDRTVRRAGLDYWDSLDITYYDSLEEFLRITRDEVRYFMTTKGRICYSEARFEPGCFLVFGKETKGLPETLIHDHPDTSLRIPMLSDKRSLNLSNSAAVVLYEALRQNGFPGLSSEGQLTRFSW